MVRTVLRLVRKVMVSSRVALQGADAGVLASVLGAVQGFADGLGQQRVCADFDEGVVIGSGGGDGLLEAHRVAHVGGPVLGVEGRVGVEVFVGGGDDRNGRGPRGEIGQLRAHRGLQGVHGRVVRGHFDIDPAGELVLRAHPGDESSIWSVGPAITVWRGEL